MGAAGRVFAPADPQRADMGRYMADAKQPARGAPTKKMKLFQETNLQSSIDAIELQNNGTYSKIWILSEIISCGYK